jgi:site-specific recombinase XerD
VAGHDQQRPADHGGAGSDAAGPLPAARFGPVPLASISQRDVRAWVTELSAKGLAPATVHKCYQVLPKILAAAVEGGMIPRSPCRQIPLPKIERAEMRFLTVAEVRRLAAAVRPSYRALILLGACCPTGR